MLKNNTILQWDVCDCRTIIESEGICYNRNIIILLISTN